MKSPSEHAETVDRVILLGNELFVFGGLAAVVVWGWLRVAEEGGC